MSIRATLAGLVRNVALGSPVKRIAWHRVRKVALVAFVAGLAALWSGYHISTSGLKQRQIEFATAEAQILVDTPCAFFGLDPTADLTPTPA